MVESANKVVYLTAGAAGMYCGSCMHDNTLARALIKQGIDVQLVPTYTPIRTDEENVSIDRVFLGGINVFLEQSLPGFRWIAPVVGPLLDQRWFLKLVTRRSTQISPRLLGKLTVSMLRGSMGRQRREVVRLCHWLASHVNPNLIVFSNVLIAGCVTELKARLRVPLLVTLQGDDIFLESLSEPYRAQALAEIGKIIPHVDGFLTHSRFYAEWMEQYLQIPREKLHQIPLGLDVEGFDAGGRAAAGPARGEPSATIGYLARLAPEKGLHVLVDAFLRLKQDPRWKDCRLRIAGYLGETHRGYAEALFARLREAGWADHFEYVGTVDRRQKIDFLHTLDVLSVPTTYREPKGLFVLEALAAGVPVVQPDHGAFPELLQQLGGGVLVPPNDPETLALRLGDLLSRPHELREIGARGREVVLRSFHAAAMAESTWSTWSRFLMQTDLPAGQRA